MAASEAAAIPFPKEETTPPVINMYFVMDGDCIAKPPAAFKQVKIKDPKQQGPHEKNFVVL
ncbi:MAG: hypothetical protein Q8O64_12495 [Sideroxyarcus sp.]|nr:hypothetical protein [Sideroxyarcus sp.]